MRYEIVCGSFRKTFGNWQTAYAYARQLSAEWLWHVTVYRTNGGNHFYGLAQFSRGRRAW